MRGLLIRPYPRGKIPALIRLQYIFFVQGVLPAGQHSPTQQPQQIEQIVFPGLSILVPDNKAQRDNRVAGSVFVMA